MHLFNLRKSFHISFFAIWITFKAGTHGCAFSFNESIEYKKRQTHIWLLPKKEKKIKWHHFIMVSNHFLPILNYAPAALAKTYVQMYRYNGSHVKPHTPAFIESYKTFTSHILFLSNNISGPRQATVILLWREPCTCLLVRLQLPAVLGILFISSVRRKAERVLCSVRSHSLLDVIKCVLYTPCCVSRRCQNFIIRPLRRRCLQWGKWRVHASRKQ